MTNAEMGGQEKISQVRLRLPWQVGKLTAFRSSLPRRSYHRSSDLKTNYPRKFSQSQGKYIGVYDPPPVLLPNLFVADGLLPVPIRHAS